MGLDVLIFNFISSLVFAPLPVEMTLMFVQDHAQPFRSGTDQSLSHRPLSQGVSLGFQLLMFIQIEVFSIWLPTDTSRQNISVY